MLRARVLCDLRARERTLGGRNYSGVPRYGVPRSFVV